MGALWKGEERACLMEGRKQGLWPVNVQLCILIPPSFLAKRRQTRGGGERGHDDILPSIIFASLCCFCVSHERLNLLFNFQMCDQAGEVAYACSSQYLGG